MRFGLYSHRQFFIRNHRRKRKIIFFFFVSVLIFFVYVFFERIYPNYISRIEMYADNLATMTINSTLSEVLAGDYSKEFVNISTDSHGIVTSVESDTIAMNKFKTELVEKLQNNINSLPDGYVSIPLGSLSNKEILSGFGPKLKFKAVPSGIASADFSEEFVSCGINQVKHKIYLDVTVTITVVSSNMYKGKTVTATVPVSETVIGGSVPNYYGVNAVSMNAGEGG